MPDSGTVVGRFDLADGRDRQLLRGSLGRGWSIGLEDLARYKCALDRALDIAVSDNNARQINSCVQTMHRIVQQVVEDELREAGEAERAIEIRFAEKPPQWINDL